MAITPGTWIDLPRNGTRDIALTFLRCAAYGTYAFAACMSWVWTAVQTCLAWAQTATSSCVSWGTTTASSCCTWWPCSWLCDLVIIIVTVVCVLVAIVVALVCIVFGVIATLVCVLVVVVVIVFCLFWTVISIVIAGSTANGGTAFLLTDGTVMMQECALGYGTRRWWKLTPDQFGSYANGSWSRLADSAVGRKYFASAVLADGRLIVCGGEYSDASGSNAADESNRCEIYDPTTDAWTEMAIPMTAGATPTSWTQIGDSVCALLPDGSFLLGNLNTPNVAKLNPATLTWAAMNVRPGSSSEESWVLMADNTIATVSCSAPPATFVYDIATDTWTAGNNLPTSIIQAPTGAGGEIGAGLLRYDGKAFFLGANQHTAVYDPTVAAPASRWTNGPDVVDSAGTSLGVMDGPAAILANGNILFGAAPINGDFKSPVTHFEFDGTVHNQTTDPADNDCPVYVTRFLLLPNADVLRAREDSATVRAYNSPTSTPQNSFRPVIQVCPTTIAPGSSISISGTQFNGLSQATGYGDDSSAATNYPLVRITNNKTRRVRYCRSSNHTSMGVATGALVVTTTVAIPADIDLGPAVLEVVANGIPSDGFAVTVQARRG